MVVGNRPSGFYEDVEQVHLVLTNYSKGEPVESEGDVSHGMPPDTLVWVVEVHAKAINWNHSEAAGPPPLPGQQTTSTTAPLPDTDYSVVMNARTGRSTDSGSADAGRFHCPSRHGGQHARRLLEQSLIDGGEGLRAGEPGDAGELMPRPARCLRYPLGGS